MTSSCRPLARIRARTGSSPSISSSTLAALCRSFPVSNSGTTSSTGGLPRWMARRASRYTAPTSAADRVKLTTYRWQASTPNRAWIQPTARRVARISAVGPDTVPPASISRSARACAALCWRISSPNAWKPNVCACQIRFCSSPDAWRAAPAPARASCTSRRSARKSAQAG